MNQSPILREILGRLTAVNDLIWLQEFGLHELEAVGARLSGKANALFTTDLFGDNPFAPRINVRMGDIPKFRARLDETLLVTVFSQAYELLAQYLKQMELDLAALGRKAWPPSRGGKKGPEKLFEESWSKSGYPAMQPELWLTYTYVRLRRNHYSHIAQVLDPRFLKFIGDHGAGLNKYWRDPSRVGWAPTLDFSSPTIFSPKTEDIVAMLRVCLLWAVEFDRQVVAQIDEAKFLQRVVRDAWIGAGGKKFTKNKETVQKLARRIAAKVRLETKSSVGVSALEPLIWATKA